MSEVTYDDVLSDAQRLPPAEQLRLMEQLAAILRRQVATKERHSILDLRGLGKEIWQDVDVQEYIDRERDSWNG